VGIVITLQIKDGEGKREGFKGICKRGRG